MAMGPKSCSISNECATHNHFKTEIKSIEKCVCLNGIDLVRTKGCSLQSAHGLTTSSSSFVIDMVVAFFLSMLPGERKKYFFHHFLEFHQLSIIYVSMRYARATMATTAATEKTATLNCYNCITTANIHFCKANLSIHYCSR